MIREATTAAATRIPRSSGNEETLALREPGFDHVFLEVPERAEIRLPPRHFGLQRVAAIIAKHSNNDGVEALLDEGARTLTPLLVRPADV